jgi:hypothetical protein
MPEITKYKLQVLAESNALTQGLPLDEYDADAADAARYRFLCDDHDSDEFIGLIEEIVASYTRHSKA